MTLFLPQETNHLTKIRPYACARFGYEHASKKLRYNRWFNSGNGTESYFRTQFTARFETGEQFSTVFLYNWDCRFTRLVYQAHLQAVETNSYGSFRATIKRHFLLRFIPFSNAILAALVKQISEKIVSASRLTGMLEMLLKCGTCLRFLPYSVLCPHSLKPSNAA